MQTLSNIQKQMPALILSAVVASYSYNWGFLLPTETGAIHTLSYNDILNSSIYLLPFVLFFYISANGILKLKKKFNQIYNIKNTMIFLVLLAIGVLLLFFSRSENAVFPIAMIALGVSPALIYGASRVFENTEKLVIVQFVSMAFMIVILFAYGYSDFHRYASPRDEVRITLTGCEECRLIRMYSDFILVIDNQTGDLKFLPNDRNISKSL